MNSSQSPKNAYEELYGKSLTPEQVAEMTFNLTDYIAMLSEMDMQYNRGSDKPTETIK